MATDKVIIDKSVLTLAMHHLRTSVVKGKDVPDFYSMLSSMHKAINTNTENETTGERQSNDDR